ncbi:MAG: regulatory protein RecX [Candidatus Kapabacteria bacterium]|nr:regulatory protein RecX [Candidatus Kapabacteria bacterium]
MNEHVYIERIIRSRLPGNCLLILSNGDNVISPLDALMMLGLNKGSNFTENHKEDIQKIANSIKIKSYSMKLAAGYARSEFQIRQKLKQKEYSKDLIDQTIIWLTKMNLIDDKRFSENFVRYGIQKKWGINKVKRELDKRGVDLLTYKDILDDFFENTDQLKTALEVTAKKMHLMRNKPKDKQKDALFRHLILKGFDYDIIKKVIYEIF